MTIKLKATKKELKSRYNRILAIGYCDAECLLQFREPFSYCVRTEGWACDNYDVGGALISTGYSPIHTKNMSKDYNRTKSYNDRALVICNDYSIGYEKQKEMVEELLIQFVKECKEMAA